MGFFDALFGGGYSRRARRDQHSFGTSLKNMVSPINTYGTCFSCDGSGTRTFDCGGCDGTGTYNGTCRACDGTGTHSYPAKPCFTCNGTGYVAGNACRRCAGSGEHRPAIVAECRKCSGTGKFSAVCSRCSGTGDIDVTCRKCGGSGWYRF